jgi:two-component system sensor histidine kinase KdpD
MGTMISATAAPRYAALKRISRPKAFEVGRGLLGTAATVAVAVAAFLLHLNLASAISILLLLTVIAAIRRGLVYATAISLTAVGCLDYFFTTPLFEFSVRSPENWVALATFEATALLVSRLSSQVKLHAQ